MKTVLMTLNAKFIHSSLAVRSIKEYCQKYRSYIHIAEYTINHEENFILREIYKQKPDILGISCYIWNIEQTLALIPTLKKILPNLVLILGGPEVSYDAEEVMRAYPQIDGIIKGEGEESFRQILEHYIDHTKSLEEIKGIVYRKDGQVVDQGTQEPLSLEKIPFAYQGGISDLQNRIIYYETTRGCPYQCQYCLSSIEKGVRYLSLERVYSDLQFFLDQKVRQVKFVDRTFNCSKNHAMQIWRFLQQQDRGITNFHFEISADLLDEETLQFLAHIRPGLFQFEIGVQSTNPQTIASIKRKMDFRVLGKIVKRIQRGNNIHQHLDLIAGLPGEDYRSFEKSFNDVYGLEPEQLQLGFLKLLKGSGLRQDAEKYELLYKDKAPYEILSTRELNYMEMLQLKMIEEMVEIFYNGGKFPHTLRYVVPYFSSPFVFFETLSMYWEEQGHHRVQHNKIQLYTILWEFCRTYVDNERVLEQLLKFDLYLQENLKTIPIWMEKEESQENKEKIRSFYQTEENIRKYLPDLRSYNSKQISRMCHLEMFLLDIVKWIESGYTELNLAETPILFHYYGRDKMSGLARFYKVLI